MENQTQSAKQEITLNEKTVNVIKDLIEKIRKERETIQKVEEQLNIMISTICLNEDVDLSNSKVALTEDFSKVLVYDNNEVENTDEKLNVEQTNVETTE